MGAPPSLAGATLLQGRSARGGGNLVYLVEGGRAPRILKLYRGRRGWLRLPFRIVSHWLERKRGVTARARFETERVALALWAQHGFDVPKLLEAPLPPGAAPPGLWMEYCPGTVLARLLRDPDRGTDEKRALLARLAADVAERLERAIALREPLLVHEHPSVVHVLVSGERLVNLDLEGGYNRSYPVRAAAAYELAGLTRSILRWGGGDEALVDAFVGGYGRPRELASLARHGLYRGGPSHRLRRLADRLRRGKLTKIDGLRHLLRALERRAPA